MAVVATAAAAVERGERGAVAAAAGSQAQAEWAAEATAAGSVLAWREQVALAEAMVRHWVAVMAQAGKVPWMGAPMVVSQHQ